MSEVERYVAQLKGENPEWPELREFEGEFFGSNLTTEATYKMIRFVIRKELQRFESKLIELLCKSTEDQKRE